ncbi:ribosome silencing factor [Marinicella gelatinilytica]|uniref:ribosome silencing factor n=1 Tax=Marinicella gelatinilytica TaxID=2996017 RepID=UPI002260B1A1|nr:ribosome silencing factor [Marinicella gelatinilytica]MCX7544008.1 ribosome silencing factor [Marinicella gelatinilytica]
MQNKNSNQKNMLTANQSLEIITTAVEDAKAQKITCLNVAHLTAITDYMIICSGTSSRHMRHIAETTLAAAEKAGLNIISREGLDSDDWMIVDVGDVIVHIMSEEARGFYQLEGLWDLAEQNT